MLLPILCFPQVCKGFPGGSVPKTPPANAGDSGDAGSIPGSGRSPGKGNSNPLQYSWLESLMDRGAWRATIHSVPKNGTQLSTHTRKGRRELSSLSPVHHVKTQDNSHWPTGNSWGPHQEQSASTFSLDFRLQKCEKSMSDV